MGKAKRFNSYDNTVAEKRKLVQSYGQARQNLSGIGSSFRSMPLEPPSFSNTESGTGTGKFCTASLSADQTTNIAATDHIEFDTLDEDGDIVLQTGSGQADGIFELESGKKYFLTAEVRAEFTDATSSLVLAWYDRTNGAEIGSRCIIEPTTSANHNANLPVCSAIVTPATNIDVEFRIISVTDLTAIANEYTQATIFEIALGGSISGSGGSGSSGVSFPITPTINDHGTVSSGTEDIDLSASTGHVHKITLGGDFTLTFSNPPSSGTQMEFEIEFIQDSTGGHTPTFPASVAETVTINSNADKVTIVTFRTNDGGTTYHAVPTLRGSISLSSTSFADTSLSNLASVAINADLDPSSDDARDLGKSGSSWKDLWINLVRFPNQESIPTNFIGIVKDTNDDLNLNVPTGEQIQLSVNGVAKHTFTATQYTGINQVLSNTLTINDSSTTPTANGEFSRNGTDVYVYSGGSARNLSNVSATSPANVALDNLSAVAINTSLISDTDSTDDLGSGSISWLNTFTDRLRFTNLQAPVGGASQIGRGTLSSTSTLYLAVPTNEDIAFLEQDSSTELLRVDTSGGTLKWKDPIIQWQIEGATSNHWVSITAPAGATAAVFDINGATGGFEFGDTVHFGSTGIDIAENGDIDMNAKNIDDCNNIDSDSSGNITGFAQVDISDALRYSSDTDMKIAFASTGITIQATSTGDDINIQSDDKVNIGPNLNELVVDSDQVTIGAATTDTLGISARIISDLIIDNGSVIKSNDATEIGFQVTNDSLTVGGFGTLQIPTDTGSAGTAAQADTDFGNGVGCMGVYLSSGGNPVLCIREADGDWGTEILTGGDLT